VESVVRLTHFMNTVCTGLIGKKKIPAAQVRNTAHMRNLSTVLASDGSGAAAAPPPPPLCFRRSGSRSWAMARRRQKKEEQEEGKVEARENQGPD
jgi:hypothetical protein